MTAQRVENAASVLSGRFALGRPHAEMTYQAIRSGDRPSRPFGLRFFRPAGEARGPGLPYRYCPFRQLSVVDDGSEELVLNRVVNWDHTTTGELDGSKGPSEEWKMDYRVDF